MKRIRVIPVLLLQENGLVKSIRFRHHQYIGDPVNAVKIFNDKEVDEIVVLDISATAEKRGPRLQQVQEIASEAFMPMAWGGGITQLDEIKKLIGTGIEKIIINTAAVQNPSLVYEAAKWAGSQSIVVSIDTKKNFWGKYEVYTRNATRKAGMHPLALAKQMEAAGAGEILLQQIDRDGSFGGYDLDIIRMLADGINIPLVAAGGAATVQDFAAVAAAGADAVAAGSMFVLQGPHRAVLISYPSQQELTEKLFTKIG